MRREYGDETGEYALALASRLAKYDATGWFAWCLARYQREAFALLDGDVVEALGGTGATCAFADGGDADAYARILVGPAWVRGMVQDPWVLRWARSEDAAWRRIAAMSTVALNTKGDGGTGDRRRTMLVCELLVDDEDPGVRKAVSKAMKALARWA